MGAQLVPEVKICGIKTRDALEAAIDAGASHFGMVFFPPSPRNIGLNKAKALAAAARGRIKSVALVVNATDAEIEAIIAAANPDLIQLHGAETPERVKAIRALANRQVIKAVSVAAEGDTEHADAYRGIADMILFDAKPPQGSRVPGGNGLAFDWHLLASVRGKLPFILSGGLTPENVAEAVSLTRPAMVDVSSGVESAPGMKSRARIRRFVRAVQASAVEELAHG